MNYTAFEKKIWNFYTKNKRDFPWRKTRDPYAILISEIMLQQTQTDRVVIKYKSWLKKFPNFKILSQAKLQDVLLEWKGLGYNRRALALKKLALVVTENQTKNQISKLPDSYEKLLELPGIGPYTAGAVLAFAFNKPVPIIETNIRTVFIHEFFLPRRSVRKGGSEKNKIFDKEILKLVEKTLDKQNPREWYWALMDYGAYLKKDLEFKKKFGNVNARSKHYVKQSKFIGSNRQIRSAMLHEITQKHMSQKELLASLYKKGIKATPEQILKNSIDLEREGFIRRVKSRYTIA